MSNNIFANLVAKFTNNNNNSVAPVGIESATAEVTSSTTSESEISVQVRYRLRSERFQVVAGTTMADLFKLVVQRFNIGSLETVSVLNESTNQVASYSEVANQPITEDESLSVEDTSGTAG